MNAQPGNATPPVLVPDRILATELTRQVFVTCPYCKKTHQHGWPYEHRDVGHRVPHCPQNAESANTSGHIIRASTTTKGNHHA